MSKIMGHFNIKLFSIFLIFTTGCLNFSNALDCYVCEYVEDLENQASCKDDPDRSALINIDDILIPGGLRSIGRNRIVSARNSNLNSMAVASTVVLSLSDRQSIQPRGYYPYKYCVKYTGKERSSGKEIVRRLGIGLKNNGGIRTECFDYLPEGVQLPDLYDARICFCDENGCNGATSLIIGIIPILISLICHLIWF